MPPTRTKDTKQAGGTAGTKFVPPPPPRFRRVPASEYGKKFKRVYDLVADPEFLSEPSPTTIPTPPTDPRPPPLALKDLQCIRTLGKGQTQVLMASIKPESLGSNAGAVFALKVVPRILYRKRRKTLKLTEELTEHLFDQHERSNLVNMYWSPFVTGLIQTFSDSHSIYMALEYIPCGTLSSLLIRQKSPLSISQSSFYFSNIVCALDFIHRQCVVHRDLKPDNVLLGADGYLCLTDFGTSAPIYSSCNWKEIATIFYRAPECYVDSPPVVPEYSCSLDWWSAGCILYEMAVGIPPFKGEIVFDTRYLALQGVKWPSDARVGRNLKKLIEDLLTIEPGKRLGADGADGVKRHPWLTKVNWEKMTDREYLAPCVPKVPDISRVWHDHPLPDKQSVPDLDIIQPPAYLAYDDRFLRPDTSHA